MLEGGSIDVNGAGTLMTTEECLLSPVQARNPHRSRAEIEDALREYLGVDRVIWLKNGIAGDDTHGHIDDLARFVAPDTVVIAQEDRSGGPQLRTAARESGDLAETRPITGGHAADASAR